MKIPSRAFGFLRVGLNGSYGVRVSNFGSGGTHENPLVGDVDPGDEAALTEFCPVFAAQSASGLLKVYGDGTLEHTGAADGTYVIPYHLWTLTPGDATVVDRGSSTVTTIFGNLTVTVDQPLSWNIRGAVAKDQTLSWDIRGAVTRDQALAWDVRGSVALDQALSWNIRGAVTRDQALLWDILNGSSVVVDQALSWNIRGAVSKDQPLAWDVRGSVSRDQPLSWNIRGAVTRDQVLAWDIRNAVLRDQAIVWDILGSLQVIVDQPLSWDIRGAVVKDQALVWNIQGDSYPDPVRIRITLQQLNGVITRVTR